MSHFAIIIPCYNEASRLDRQEFLRFIQQFREVRLFFVNDGSKDDTLTILKNIQSEAPDQIDILDLKRNKGKGEAVRLGILAALKQQSYEYIGYLDADLSTSLSEFYRIYQYGLEIRADLILASRIKKIDTVIQRSFFRHAAGRLIATAIDQRFKLGIYDTQCGAKIFKTNILTDPTTESFYTQWFFDVELFIRIKRKFTPLKAVEVPLNSWHSVKGSKLNLSSSPKVLKELFILFSKYSSVY